MTPPLCLLDFDGVIFDSAQEVYTICQEMAASGLVSRTDVEIAEFMNFRKLVKDAWQFSYLYNKPNDPLPGNPEIDDEEFAHAFFKTRADLAKDSEWFNKIPAYPFFKRIKKHMLNHPNAFKIISTRNEDSILKILHANDVNEIDVLGQASIKKSGGKIQAANMAGLLGRKQFTLYIDDMLEYSNQFSSYVDFAMHASWGYGCPSEKSLSETSAAALIDALFMDFNNEI